MKQRGGVIIAGAIAGILLIGMAGLTMAAERVVLDEAVAEIAQAYQEIETMYATLVQRDVQEGRTINITAELQYAKPYYFRADVDVWEHDPTKVMRSLTVYDGTVLWNENYDANGAVVNVMKTTVDAAAPASELFLKQFMPVTIFTILMEQYRLDDVREKGDLKILDMVMNEGSRVEMEQEAMATKQDISDRIPLQVKFYWDTKNKFCQKIETLNARQKVISTIEYQDVVINAPADNTLFVYTPPADVPLMDMTVSVTQRLDAAFQGSMIGKPIPDFTLTDLNGRQVGRDRFLGKILVINFWSTRVHACREELQVLDRIYYRLKDDPQFAFLTVSKEPHDVTEQFMLDYEISVPAFLDRDGSMSQAFGVDGIPRTFVVNKDGTIFHIFRGFQPNMDRELEHAFRRMQNL